MQHPTTQPPSQSSSLIDATELGAMLTASTRTIRRYDAAGRIPRPIKLGGLTRWRREEIADWIAAGCPRRSDWQWRK